MSTPKRIPPLRHGFVSPMLDKDKNDSQRKKSLGDECEELRLKEAALQAEIDVLGDSGLSNQELDSIMQKLHRYNELKDVAQALIGLLAGQQHVTVREVHERLGLPTTDE